MSLFLSHLGFFDGAELQEGSWQFSTEPYRTRAVREVLFLSVLTVSMQDYLGLWSLGYSPVYRNHYDCFHVQSYRNTVFTLVTLPILFVVRLSGAPIGMEDALSYHHKVRARVSGTVFKSDRTLGLLSWER